MLKIKITKVDYHRNGSFGEGFHVVTFDLMEWNPPRPTIGIVFDPPGQIAILDLEHCTMRWHAEDFEEQIRLAVAMYEWDRTPNTIRGPAPTAQSIRDAMIDRYGKVWALQDAEPQEAAC